MKIMKQFLKRYQAEFDQYEKQAQACAQQIQRGLERMGVRGIVTYRAKRPDRLWQKLSRRSASRQYESLAEIYDDIIDLAGVRIALYFPGDAGEVDAFLRAQFAVAQTRDYPRQANPPPYPKRFSGYSARHYYLQIPSWPTSSTPDTTVDRWVEVQVASVLMHAWAEVEHDLAYKPKTGKLSADEYAILDELNGLIQAGEIALERLQKAVHRRVIGTKDVFNNHYDLSAFVYEQVQGRGVDERDPVMGRTDVLFAFLRSLGRHAPGQLQPYVNAVDCQEPSRTVAEQIVDAILAEDETLYQAYNDARLAVSKKDPFGSADEAVSYFAEERALGYFMHRWIALEAVFRKTASDTASGAAAGKLLQQETLSSDLLEPETAAEISRIRRLRDQVIYGMEFPSEQELMAAGNFLERVLVVLAAKKPELQRSLESALQQPKSRL